LERQDGGVHKEDIVMEEILKIAHKTKTPVPAITPASTHVFKIKTQQNEKTNQKTRTEQKNYFKSATVREG